MQRAGENPAPPAVGARLWHFDTINRVYARDENGRAYGGPIYAEYFQPAVIVGEEGRSWLVRHEGWSSRIERVGKAQRRQRRYFTDTEKADDIFVQEHRYRLGERVRRCDEAQVLRQVAALLGYEVTS